MISSVVSQIVAFGDNNEIYTSGTATCVAKNIHITAAHVLTDLLEDQFGFTDNQTHFDLWLVQVKPGPEYIIWQALNFWVCPYSDIAIIHTKAMNEEAASLNSVPSLRMNLAPPAVGEKIVGFGFHSSGTSKINIGEDGTRNIEIEGIGSATIGHVQEVHQIKRDSVRLTFPCYQVNARFDGGMSGGPVLNDNGELCGVICSSLPPFSDDEEHVSYVATLWPSMSVSMNIDPSTGNRKEDYYPLFNLVDKGLLSATSSERVIITAGEGNIRYGIQFTKQTT